MIKTGFPSAHVWGRSPEGEELCGKTKVQKSAATKPRDGVVSLMQGRKQMFMVTVTDTVTESVAVDICTSIVVAYAAGKLDRDHFQAGRKHLLEEHVRVQTKLLNKPRKHGH